MCGGGLLILKKWSVGSLLIFTESAQWANSVYKLLSRSVVCVFVSIAENRLPGGLETSGQKVNCLLAYLHTEFFAQFYWAQRWRPLARSEGGKVIFTVCGGGKHLTKTTPPEPSKPVMYQHSVDFNGSVFVFVCLYVFVFVCLCVCLCVCARWPLYLNYDNFAFHVRTIHLKPQKFSHQ